jgi:hypothetical protein
MKQRFFDAFCIAAAIVSAVTFGSASLTGQQEIGSDGRTQLSKKGPAGPVPRTKDGKPDMRGHWATALFTASNILEDHGGGFGLFAGKSVIIDPPDGKIPYQPWALAQRDKNRRPENAYLDNEGRCILAGVPRIMLFAFEIAYAPDTVALFYDYVHHTRIIPTDGRPHLPKGIELYMGNPVGRWEGDTLVVDSTNFNGKVWFALGGDFMTSAGHIVERFKMTDSNTLTYTATIDDPKAFTRPWTMTTAAPFEKEPAFELIEDSCHEGNADLVHMKHLYDEVHKNDAK